MSGTHKVYSGDRTIDGAVVRVDGSIFRPGGPQGFEWGYEGASPLELSRAILTDHLGDKGQAERLAAPFMRDVVANFANEWEMTSADVDQVVKAISPRPQLGEGKMP